MLRINSSILWDYFEKTNAGSRKAKCKLCRAEYSYKTSTGNLTAHIRKIHPTAYRLISDAKNERQKNTKTIKSEPDTQSVWDYFEIDDHEEKKATCQLCMDLYSYKTSTGNLKSHLKKMHGEAYESIAKARQEDYQDIVTPTKSSGSLTPVKKIDDPLLLSTTPITIMMENGDPFTVTATTSPITNSLPTGKLKLPKDTHSSTKKMSKDLKQQIDNDLLRLFIKGYQPFSLVEEEDFKRFTSWIPGYTLPTKKTISNVMIPTLYEQTIECVKTELANSGVEHVCLTGELWTSRANETYFAITGHYVNNDFFTKSVLLTCSGFPQPYTSEHIQAALQDTVTKWDLEDKINFVVTANEPIISEAVGVMGWEHYVCYAHTLNSIVENTLKNLDFILDKVKEIVLYFKNNSIAQTNLLEAQLNEDAACIPRGLIHEVPTRWNSAYYMLQRFVHLESYLQTVIPQDLPIITEKEWRFCAELCQILKPFDDATTSLSGQHYMTLSSVIAMTRCLISGCEQLLCEDFAKDSKQVILELKSGLITRFVDVEGSDTFAVCTFLDPRYKLAVFADTNEANKTRKRVQDMLVDAMATEFENDDEMEGTHPSTGQKLDKFSPWAVLQDIVSQKQNVGTPSSKALKEIKTYLNEDILPVFRADGSWNCPMKWWRNNKHRYPNLSRLIKRYCNIMATSVPCECVFSETGLIINERRSLLTNSKVEQLTFLNMNLND